MVTMTTIPADVDPSDVFDTEREWEIPNVDIPAPPIPGTTDIHPERCRCLPCRADAEALDWLDRHRDEGPACWVCDGFHDGRSCPIDGGW